MSRFTCIHRDSVSRRNIEIASTYYSSFRRSESHKMEAVFFSSYLVAKRGSWSQAFLPETVETGHENLVNVLDNSARYSTMSKGKNMSNVLANGVIFSTLKHTDPRTVRGRSTLKVGKLVSVHFETGRSANSIAKESNDLAKVLPELNQKSHDPQGSSS